MAPPNPHAQQNEAKDKTPSTGNVAPATLTIDAIFHPHPALPPSLPPARPSSDNKEVAEEEEGTGWA